METRPLSAGYTAGEPAACPPPDFNNPDRSGGQLGSAPGRDTAEAARSVARDVREQAGGAAQRAKEQAGAAASEARRKTAEYVDQARQHGQSMLEQQKRRAADQLHTAGAAVHRAADKFREERDDNIAGYVDAAADEVDRLAGYLERRDLHSLMRDAQRFARRQPEWFLGGMFVAGLALTRFLRATRADSDHDYYEGYGDAGYRVDDRAGSSGGGGGSYGVAPDSPSSSASAPDHLPSSSPPESAALPAAADDVVIIADRSVDVTATAPVDSPASHARPGNSPEVH